ncbi:MAG: hypothetical protein ACI4KM_10155 [Oscillospiraceae bacterium]
MNDNDFNKLIQAASAKLGTSPEQLRKALERGDMTSLTASLSKSDKEKLRMILSNKALMEKLRSAGSPDDILKMLGQK